MRLDWVKHFRIQRMELIPNLLIVASVVLVAWSVLRGSDYVVASIGLLVAFVGMVLLFVGSRSRRS